MPIKVRTSAILIFLIGLPLTGAKTQTGLSFTVATGPIFRNSAIGTISVQPFPGTLFGYIGIGPTSRSPYENHAYGIYSRLRGHYYSPEYYTCWDYTWNPYSGLFSDWLWGCDPLTGLVYRSIFHSQNRFLPWRTFAYNSPPGHVFAYWQDPFVGPWGPYWAHDPWAPFWDDYWAGPSFGGHFPGSYPAVPAIVEPEVPGRTATRRPSSRVGSPPGYGGGSDRTPRRTAVPRTSATPSMWPGTPVMDSRDPEASKAKPRGTRSRPAPSDFVRPPSAHPSPDRRRASGTRQGPSSRPSDRLRDGATVPRTKAVPRMKPRSQDWSPYPKANRSPSGGLSTKPSLGSRPSPKARTQANTPPRIRLARPTSNRVPRTVPSQSRTPKAQAMPRTSPRVTPKPPRPSSRPTSTARRTRRPGN